MFVCVCVFTVVCLLKAQASVNYKHLQLVSRAAISLPKPGPVVSVSIQVFQLRGYERYMSPESKPRV